MNESLKEILEQSNEIYINAVEGTSKIISEHPLLSATDRLLCILIQVEVTNGSILKEILSSLNTPKDGDTK
jgi:hypothetical protein